MVKSTTQPKDDYFSAKRSTFFWGSNFVPKTNFGAARSSASASTSPTTWRAPPWWPWDATAFGLKLTGGCDLVLETADLQVVQILRIFEPRSEKDLQKPKQLFKFGIVFKSNYGSNKKQIRSNLPPFNQKDRPWVGLEHDQHLAAQQHRRGRRGGRRGLQRAGDHRDGRAGHAQGDDDRDVFLPGGLDWMLTSSRNWMIWKITNYYFVDFWYFSGVMKQIQATDFSVWVLWMNIFDISFAWLQTTWDRFSCFFGQDYMPLKLSKLSFCRDGDGFRRRFYAEMSVN